MNKKLGLEHTIRNLLSESLGGGITTDKFSKTPRSFFKPVHIEPKKAGEHVNGTSTVRAARNAQLSKDSETVKEEEQLDEFLAPTIKLIGRAAAPYVDDLLKIKPKAFEPPLAPVKPAKPTVKPAPAVPKPAPAPVPAAPKPAPAPVPAVPRPVPAPGSLPTPSNVPATGPSTTPVPAPAPGPAASPSSGKGKEKQPNKTKIEEPSKKDRRRLPFPTLTIDPVPLETKGGYVPVDSYTHMAQDRRTYGEAMENDDKREDIENVPRRNSRNRTRQAEIIRKIIEEKKNKKKIISTVKINPELKNQEADQN